MLKILILPLLVSLACATENIPIKCIFPGNWADPTVTKIGDTYYLTSNNDRYEPSVMVFKSKNLRNWEPISYACPNETQGPATDIAAYDGKLYIYGGSGQKPWVCVSEAPYTEWSERINMQPVAPHGIDVGHIADERGNRYIYTNRGFFLPISKDGLKALAAPMKVYDGWKVPPEIDIECECLESPKLFKRGKYYYMVSAIGGTVGPATSHMAVVARSENVEGPWENDPDSPLIYTKSIDESWWSKGHATLVEGPEGNWFAIYHGYVPHQRSFGRCTLISPIEWTEDDWPVIAETWPSGWDEGYGFSWPMSDEFEGSELGMQWQAHMELDRARYAMQNGKLIVTGYETDEPASSFPISINPAHTSYEVETELTLYGGATAGLILYYSNRATASVGLNPEGKITQTITRASMRQRSWDRGELTHPSKTIKLKIVNDNQQVSYFVAGKGESWQKLERSDDISGFQHNIFGGFVSVRPGIFVIGDGSAEFSYFRYKGLASSKL